MFDLEKFKSGHPAVTRGGQVAHFVRMYAPSEAYPITASAEGVERAYTLEGSYFYTWEHDLDLVSMAGDSSREGHPPQGTLLLEMAPSPATSLVTSLVTPAGCSCFTETETE